ncbi:hypothetical protein [Mycolicibacter sinensis]
MHTTPRPVGRLYELTGDCSPYCTPIFGGKAWRAGCRCGWLAPIATTEHAAREAMATHYVADDSDDAALARAKQRHPAGKGRRHEAVITAAGGRLHAGCSGCGWTFTGLIGREVVAEAAGHVEAAEALGALGLTR